MGSEGCQKTSQTQDRTESDVTDFVLEERNCMDYENGYCPHGSSCMFEHHDAEKQKTDFWGLLNNYPELLLKTSHRPQSFLL